MFTLQETHTKEKKMTEIMTNFTAGDMLGTHKKKPSNPPKHKKKDKVVPKVIPAFHMEEAEKEEPQAPEAPEVSEDEVDIIASPDTESAGA
jgi:hypothetical protein